MVNYSFRSNVFDPLLIISQIVGLQSIFYLGLLLQILILELVNGDKVTLDGVFSYEQINFATVFGWGLISILLSNSAISAVAILKLVERAKLCLDFSCTMYGIHLIAVYLYAGLPNTISWWAVFLGCNYITVKLSRKLCMEEELKPIELSRSNEMEMQDFI
jgi:hypothetical protein